MAMELGAALGKVGAARGREGGEGHRRNHGRRVDAAPPEDGWTLARW
jgi:hypothetical protein